LGANEYLQGKHNQAIKWLELSAQVAESPALYAQLSDSYLMLSEVFATMGDYKHSQEAYRKHIEAKQALELQQKLQSAEIQRRKQAAQERETQSRLLVSDKEKQLMQLKQERLEAEKKVKELQLVTREKDLQTEKLRNEELEKARAQQALDIAKQQLEAARRDREIANLEREREMQQFTLMQKEFEEQQQKNAVEKLSQQNALLEQTRQLQEAQSAQDQVRQRYSNFIIALISLLLIAAIIAFLWTRKQQRRIKEQNLRILDQNKELEAQKEALELQQAMITEKNEELMTSEEELRQNAEELLSINEQVNQTLAALQDQKKLVDKKNADIMASINYAKRIQQAILPDLREIKKHLPQSFVFYQPKDIVSGDFFWIHQEGQRIFVAAVDCTGHGVPGAFMSLIGTSLLREFVVDKKVEDPGRILDLLHIGVVERLRKKETDSKDGMDASICVIDQEAKTLKFAGANNPVVYIQNGELYEVKADKYAIGGAKDLYNEHFETHTVNIVGPTVVYLFSDGMQDQFGGPEGRKFMRKRLKEVFFEMHQLPMNEQLEKMVDHYNDWVQNSYKQTDDILIIGFEV
jgi:serine phosphatase RsbU (regulator of sigma subunit)